MRLIMVDRVDPLEMAVDAMARKANVVDARYLRRKKIMSREAFEERWPGMLGSSDPDRPDKHVTRTGHGYDDDEADSEDVPNEDEVTVCEYQWYDLAAGARRRARRQDDRAVARSRCSRPWKSRPASSCTCRR
jgi:hypothetical protein